MTGLQSRFRIGARHRIIDDRGRAVPLCSAEQLPPGSTNELLAIVGSANMHRWGTSLVMAATMSVIFVLARWLLEMGGCGRTNPAGTPGRGLGQHLLLLGSVFVANFVTLLIVFSLFARQSGLAAIRTLHEAGLCPSCAYTVRGIPAEADGCVVCPECAAAWREGSDEAEKG